MITKLNTKINLRDLDAIARAPHAALWQVLRDLENDYLSDDDDY
jgi:hypothetical protein